MNKTLTDYLLGKTNGQDTLRAIHSLELAKGILTPKERFNLITKLDWVTWSTQKWNSNYTNISYKAFREQHIDWLNNKGSNYCSIYIHTGTFPGL